MPKKLTFLIGLLLVSILQISRLEAQIIIIPPTSSGGITLPVSLSNGGTGASLTDPNADRILFWDDSAGSVAWLTAGTGLSISGTTITATGFDTSACTNTWVLYKSAGAPCDASLLYDTSAGLSTTKDMKITSGKEFHFDNTTGTPSAQMGTIASYVLHGLDIYSGSAASMSGGNGGNLSLYAGNGDGAGVKGNISVSNADQLNIVVDDVINITGLNVTLDANGSLILIGDNSSIKASSYKSSDGSPGVTVSACTGFKNGLCISGT